MAASNPVTLLKNGLSLRSERPKALQVEAMSTKNETGRASRPIALLWSERFEWRRTVRRKKTRPNNCGSGGIGHGPGQEYISLMEAPEPPAEKFAAVLERLFP